MSSSQREHPRPRRPPSEPSSASSSRSLRHERASRFDPSAFGDGAPDRASGWCGASSTSRDNQAGGASKVDDDTKDYRKMYEQALLTNEKLKSRLEDSKKELCRIQAQLNKVTQKDSNMSEKSSVLEAEKKEKQNLEKKIWEMEDELKVRTDLKSENQRLKDENGALIRVISKLSK
ncbi:protein phosphatase 1 regulatory subunit 12B-like isoform X1 [Denticeps clupeoides]|uniref:cGMP-dependent protein kinase interacting domain-containing protein n=1 Tax=Denticeps clupeoides TaxID=299321 RepID=A0AAY4BRH6_9TELE|nr:protein phosphatase 1 regulatory subunit 12B-like isoform X1 [Denticeps clupeoides]